MAEYIKTRQNCHVSLKHANGNKTRAKSKARVPLFRFVAKSLYSTFYELYKKYDGKPAANPQQIEVMAFRLKGA